MSDSDYIVSSASDSGSESISDSGSDSDKENINPSIKKRQRIVDLRNNNLIMVIWYKSHWIVATNIDAGRSQSTISADKNPPVFVYDSLPNPTYLNGLALTLSHMFPTKISYAVQRPYIYFPQVSVNDCGLFASAYVRSFCLNREPSLLKFCQDTMRFEYNQFIERDCKEFKTNIIADYSQSHVTSMTPYAVNLNLLHN